MSPKHKRQKEQEEDLILIDALEMILNKEFKNWEQMIAQALAYVAVKKRGHTCAEAGKILGKHPTTIMRNLERAEQQIIK